MKNMLYHLGFGPRILSSSSCLFTSSRCSSSILNLSIRNRASSCWYGDDNKTVEEPAKFKTLNEFRYKYICYIVSQTLLSESWSMLHLEKAVIEDYKIAVYCL